MRNSSRLVYFPAVPQPPADQRPTRWGLASSSDASPPLPDASGRADPRASAARSPEALRTAVAAAYERHRGLVYRLALRYGRNRPAWAEDVTQEVFLQLVRHAEALDDLHALEGWLYRVTTRRCLSRLRNERVLGWVTLEWLVGASSSQEPTIDGDALAGARDELRRALDALGSLPPKERVAFAMYHLDGRALDEIGAVLGHTKGYVSKLVQRATSRLVAQGWEVDDG